MPFAQSAGNTVMNQWGPGGMGSLGDPNYVLRCDAYSYAGSNVVMRMTMGEAVDYFKPVVGYNLCGGLRRACAFACPATRRDGERCPVLRHGQQQFAPPMVALPERPVRHTHLLWRSLRWF